MKIYVSSFIILILIFTPIQIHSQNIDERKSNVVKEINDILKNNPYTDDFQEITFYYSVDITPLNELVVVLEYDGPFKTIFRSRISDLNTLHQENPAMIPSTYLCWRCKSIDSKEITTCVQNEIIYTSGQKESHTSGEISVMFSNDKKVYRKLCDAFERLFNECSEEENKL